MLGAHAGHSLPGPAWPPLVPSLPGGKSSHFSEESSSARDRCTEGRGTDRAPRNAFPEALFQPEQEAARPRAHSLVAALGLLSETRPYALVTCSAMIPKSPKQAYCTKFLLSTRMQPAGKGEARVRGHGVGPGPGDTASLRPQGQGRPSELNSSCGRVRARHSPTDMPTCYRERAGSAAAATGSVWCCKTGCQGSSPPRPACAQPGAGESLRPPEPHSGPTCPLPSPGLMVLEALGAHCRLCPISCSGPFHAGAGHPRDQPGQTPSTREPARPRGHSLSCPSRLRSTKVEATR